MKKMRRWASLMLTAALTVGGMQANTAFAEELVALNDMQLTEESNAEEMIPALEVSGADEGNTPPKQMTA